MYAAEEAVLFGSDLSGVGCLDDIVLTVVVESY